MAIVGSAKVKIVADVSGLAKSIQDQLGSLDALGKKMGKSFGENMRDGIKDGIGDPAGLIGEADGKKSGDAFGKGFAAGAKPHFAKLGREVGTDMGKNLADDVNSSFASNLNVKDPLKEQLAAGGKEGGKAGGKAAGDEIEDGISRAGGRAANSMSSSGKKAGTNFGKSFKSAADSGPSSGPFQGMIEGLAQNIVQMQVLSGALAGVVSAASAAAGAIVGVGSALVYAAPAALQFANVLAALAQGFIVGKTLFSGVGGAVKAYSTSLTQSTKASNTASKASKNLQKDLMSEEERLLRIREARDALNDAIIEGARANEDAVEAVSDAQESLSDAIEGASDATEDFTDSVEDLSDAERDLADAMEDEKKALDDLNDARAEAQERLEDLALELERASLNEERAALNLKKAEEELANARAGGNTNAIYEADLAYREQLQSVKELQESNGDLRDEANKAQSEGVDGNENVIDAQRAYRDSIEATSDAQEALRDAIEGVSDAQEAQRDSVEATSDAQRELARAVQDVARIAEDASIRIARAQLNLKKALEDTGNALAGLDTPASGAAGGIDKVATAFDKLSPAAQHFVRFWVDDVIPVFERIKELGQEEFFPKFEQAIKNIIENDKMMRILEQTYVDTAKVLGDLSIQLSEAFTTPETLTALEEILDSNIVILENLGTAAINLVQPLTQVFAATAPYAEAWSESVEKATEKFSLWIDEMNKPVANPFGEATSPMEDFFATASRLAGKLWEIIKNIGTGLGTIFEAALPAGEYFLDRMITMSAEWAAGLEDNKAELTGMFRSVSANAADFMDLLGTIGGAFASLGANPALGSLARALESIIPQMGELAEDGFNQVAGAMEKMILALPPILEFFQETQMIAVFADVIAGVVDVLSVLVGWIIDANEWIDSWGPNIIAVTGFLLGLGKAFSLLTGLAGTFLGTVSKGIKALSFGRIDLDFGFGKNKKAASTAQKAFDDVKKVMTKEKKLISELAEQIGKDITQGLATGIQNNTHLAVQEAKQLGDKTLDALRNALGTHSESIPAREAGLNVAQGLGSGMNAGQPGAVQEADQLGDAVVDKVQEGAYAGGQQAANQLAEGHQAGLRSEIPESKVAAKELEDAAARGVKEGAVTDGRAGGTAIGEGEQAGLRAEIPETKIAAQALQDAAGNAIKTGAFADGEAGGSALGEGQQAGIKLEIPEAKLAAEQLQNSVGRALITGALADGNVAGHQMGEGMQAGLALEGAELTAAGAAAAQKVQNGVNMNPVTVPISGGTALPGGKGKGAGKGAAKGAAKKKGGRKAVTAGLAAIPIPGARIVAGGLAAAGAISTVSSMAQASSEETQASFEETYTVASEAMEGLQLVASETMTQVQADTLNAMSTVELQTIQSMYDAGYLTAEAMTIVDEAVAQTAANSQSSFDEVSNNVLSSTDTSQRELIRILYTSGALTAEAMTMVDEAVKEVSEDTEVVTVGLGNLGVVAQGVMTETQAEIINTMDVAERETIKSLYDAGYLTEDAMAIVNEAVAQTATVAEESFATVSNSTLAATDQAQRDLIQILYNSGALTAEAMVMVDTALIEMQTGISETNDEIEADAATTSTSVSNSYGAATTTVSGDFETMGTYANGYMKTTTVTADKESEKVESAYSTASDNMIEDSDMWAKEVKGDSQEATDTIVSDMEQVEEDTLSIWDNIGSGISGIWDAIVNDFNKAIGRMATAWNKYVVDNINKIPGVEMPKWTPPAAYAEGGLVEGPNGPPDNVLARLTPGEYVLTKDMVQQVGVSNLDAWRRGISASGGTGGPGGKGGSATVYGGKGGVFGTFDKVKNVINDTVEKFSANKIFSGILKWFRDLPVIRRFASDNDEEQAKKEASSGGNVPPYDGPPGGWTYPLSKKVTPRTYAGHRNTGAYDFAVSTGTSIFAVTAGKVVISKSVTGSYGQHVKLSHTSDTSLYAHMSKRLVQAGQIVKTGQKIGLVGSTGNSTGPHLHLEISPPANTVSKLKSHGVAMARGGIVPATPGGLLALIGEAGRAERVTPLDSQGRSTTEVEVLNVLKGMAEQRSGSGDTFNVFPSAGMNERELAIKVSRQVALTHRRRS